MSKQTKTARRGRPLMNTSAYLVAAFAKIEAGERVAVQTIRIARERGLIAPEPIKSGKRGRPAYRYVVTGKGRSLAALLKRNAERPMVAFGDAMARAMSGNGQTA